MLKKITIWMITLTMVMSCVFSRGGLFTASADVTSNIVLNAAADAYVLNGQADTNFGSGQLMAGKSSTNDDRYLAYIKFDITSNSSDYTRAKFSIVDKLPASYEIDIYGVHDTAWTEEGITWNNAPGRLEDGYGFGEGTTYIGEIVFDGTVDCRGEIDITDYLQSRITAGDTFITIGISSEVLSSLGDREDWKGRYPQLTMGLDATELGDMIDTSKGLLASTAVGSGEQECSQEAKGKLEAAVFAAESVYLSFSSTKEEIDLAYATISNAVAVFREAIGNTVKERYDNALAQAAVLQTKASEYEESDLEKLAQAVTAAQTEAEQGSQTAYAAAVLTLEQAMRNLVNTKAINPVPLDLIASEDAYIDSKNAQDVNGNISNLVVGSAQSTGFQLAYIKFDISSYTGKYGRARFSIVSKDSSPYTLNIYGLPSADWTEESLTWNNAPNKAKVGYGFGAGAEKLGTIIHNGTASTRTEIDISDYMKRHNTDDFIVIGICAQYGDPQRFLVQKEDSNGDRKPHLILGLDMGELAQKINEAHALNDSIQVGTEDGNCSQQAKDEFNIAIAAAEAVRDSYNSTQSNSSDALAALELACQTFKDAAASAAKTNYESVLARAEKLLSKATEPKYMQSAINQLSDKIEEIKAKVAEETIDYRAAAEELENAMNALVSTITVIPNKESLVLADTYISRKEPNVNFGTNNNLRVGNSTNDECLSLVRFDISDCTGEYQRAKFSIVSKDEYAYTLNVYGLPDTGWQENELTWESASDMLAGTGFNAVKIAEIEHDGTKNKTYEVDIADYFKNHNTDDTIVIGFSYASGSFDAYLNSHDSTYTEAGKPQMFLGLDASELKGNIDAARELNDSVSVGLGWGHCSREVKETFTAAIEQAQAVYASYTSTRDQIDSAAAELAAATVEFEANMDKIEAAFDHLTIDDKEETELKNGNAVLKINLKNHGSTPQKVQVLFALFKGTEELASLEDVAVKTVDLSAGGSAVCDGMVTVNDATGRFVKIFVWSEDFQPKTEYITLP